MEAHVTKYKTGQTGIIISAIVFILTGSVAIACGVMDMQSAEAVAIVAAVLASGALMLLLDSFREILLFDDRLEVKSIFRGTVENIKYSDISHIGFQKSHFAGLNSYDGIDPASVKSDDLIIVLRDGESEELDGSDFDHLHEVYDFLQERINSEGIPA